ncbi:MAG: GNAT family N-acetyltransferase [Candidatus Acidiferrales bacterium]|jgi:RimJ/RimL family protein N-acetyltransferase
MNTQWRSGDDPAESSLFSRFVSQIRYLGIRAIPRLIFYRLLPASIYYRSIRCVWMDLDDWRQRYPVHPPKTVPFEIRPLDAEDLKVKQILTELDLDPEAADIAIKSRVEIFATLQDKSIMSYLLVSPVPPGLNDDLILEFDDRLAYFYRAFTRPELRGRGLMPSLLQAALARCASRGYRGVVACIDMGNSPSWRAFRSAGFKTLATIRLAKVGGQYWICPRNSQTTPRFHVLPVKRTV